MRKQFVKENTLFAGEHYGPGYVEVPDEFPKPTDDEARMTEDASLLSEFETHRDDFQAYLAARQKGAQNDAAVNMPESGQRGIPTGAALGENQGAITGEVKTETVPDNAAGKQDGDPLNPKATTKGAKPAPSA